MLKKIVILFFPIILFSESLRYKNGDIIFAVKQHMIKSGVDTFLQCYMSGNWGKCSSNIVSYDDTVFIYPKGLFENRFNIDSISSYAFLQSVNNPLKINSQYVVNTSGFWFDKMQFYENGKLIPIDRHFDMLVNYKELNSNIKLARFTKIGNKGVDFVIDIYFGDKKISNLINNQTNELYGSKSQMIIDTKAVTANDIYVMRIVGYVPSGKK
jgi:hypothetical protein